MKRKLFKTQNKEETRQIERASKKCSKSKQKSWQRKMIQVYH